MCTKVVPNISRALVIGLFVLACDSERPKNNPTSSSVRELPDTSYIAAGSRLIKQSEYDSLSDSLMDVYARQIHKSTKYSSLDLKAIPYSAYATPPYDLGDSTWGNLILFRPKRNEYYTSQLYLTDGRGIVKDAIELAYYFSNDGVDGIGESLLINQGGKKIVYNKRYWKYPVDGVELDTIVGYEIRQGRKHTLLIPEEERKKLRQLFRQYNKVKG